MSREHCYVCDKVRSLCLCARVVPVENQTPLTIVQHPAERRHPFGTVRIARLGLRNVTIHETDRPTEALRVPAGAVVLWPEKGAPILGAHGARLEHLVAIDGTWSQAAQLRRTHPVLSQLPAVRLPAGGGPSRYRLRREPNDESLSTIEAIVRALMILEPETAGLEGLLTSFDAMIDDQLDRRDEHARSPRFRHRTRTPTPLPEVFRDPSRPVALLHAELHQPRGQTLRFPLHVTVARGEPRELLDVRVRSPLPPSPRRVRNMELGETLDDASALDLPAVGDALRAFLRPTDTIVAWAQYPEPVLRALGVEQPFLSAKHWLANQTGGRLGTIEDVIRGLDGPPVEPWAPGRAGRQLAQLARVVEALRARA